jgi:hypothetical protein
MAANIQDIRHILQEARMGLMDRPNVIATGIGYKTVNGRMTDQLSIICSVDTKKPKVRLSAADLVPSSLNGIPTDVYPSGVIYAQQAPTEKFRPAPGGVSIGHKDITAGTLGCLVLRNNQIHILSNNHVLANSNEADNGDTILQPGPYDGGSNPGDKIGTLSAFIPIVFDGGDGNGGGGSPCAVGNAAASVLNGLAALFGSKTRLQTIRPRASENLVDCAVCRPTEDSLVKNEILNIGQIAGLAEGTLGLSVQKSGRTTGYTTGTITQIDVTVQVSYGSNKVATFVDQLMSGAMSQGGDSGSAVLDMNKNLIGLLFAGSSSTTIFNRIQNVFSALNLSLV